MATLEPCAFSKWSMSDEEILMASVLNPQQKQLIQSDLAQTAEQILSLTYDPLNPVDFAQQDAHLKGQMAAYRYILTRSDESELALKSLASSKQN